jgi:hypothetical protein
MKTETGLTVKVNIETIIAECLENAVRSFFLNDFEEIREAPDTLGTEWADNAMIARCAEKIDNRFWCELEPLVKFPDFYAEDE